MGTILFNETAYPLWKYCRRSWCYRRGNNEEAKQKKIEKLMDN